MTGAAGECVASSKSIRGPVSPGIDELVAMQQARHHAVSNLPKGSSCRRLITDAWAVDEFCAASDIQHGKTGTREL